MNLVNHCHKHTATLLRKSKITDLTSLGHLEGKIHICLFQIRLYLPLLESCHTILILEQDPLLPSAGNAYNKLQFFKVSDVNDTPLNVWPCAVYNLHNHSHGPGCHSDFFQNTNVNIEKLLG